MLKKQENIKQKRWKAITGYPDYMLSDEGDVISLKYNKTKKIKSFIGSRSFSYVNLSKKGIAKQYAIHLLVYKAFGEHSEYIKDCTIKHKDGLLYNNHIDNLIAIKKEGSKKERNSNVLLNKKDIIQIKMLLKLDKSIEYISQLFRISGNLVVKIENKKTKKMLGI